MLGTEILLERVLWLWVMLEHLARLSASLSELEIEQVLELL